MFVPSRSRFLFAIVITAILLGGWVPTEAQGDETFRIGIMQARQGAANKYLALESYLKLHDIQVEFLATESYPHAAAMFAKGEVDGMFSGSGVAGTMIIKNLAYPLVRPVDKAGRSTYWAVVVAPKGSPEFTGQADYFAQKRIECCSLASSGEFFVRSIPGMEQVDAQLVPANSHGAAVAALDRGEADVAVIKNLVWDSLAEQYPDLTAVGSDGGQNPNGTLIVSKQADKALIKGVTKALLDLGKDVSPEAEAARAQLGVKGFILTSAADFKHTLALLEKAGVTSEFEFQF